MQIVPIKNHLLSNISKTKMDKIKGIVIYMNISKYDSQKYEENYYKEIVEANSANKDQGFHYVIMQKQISKLVDDKYKVLTPGSKATYINSNLYGGKAKDCMISIEVLIGQAADAEVIDQNLIRFIAELLKKHKLKPYDVWRARDLFDDIKEPLHYIETRHFQSMVSQLKKFIPDRQQSEDKPTEDEMPDNIIFDDVEFESAFKGSSAGYGSVNAMIRKIIEQGKLDTDGFAKKHKIWDKGIDGATNNNSSGELKTKEYSDSKNTLQYTVSQNAPNGNCQCSSPYDSMNMTNTTQATLVEPIYPDIIVPPGGTIVIAQESGIINHEAAETEHPDLDDFENRQNTFDFEGFSDAFKETKGRPVNPEDPFPVDEQIKKLEEHFPKVKIDKIITDFTDTNHSGSVLGQAMAKNFAMSYDIMAEISKRTEKRLVKIENNLSTVMRNLFRMSSRVNINCVYYGGQSVYGMKKLNY